MVEEFSLDLQGREDAEVRALLLMGMPAEFLRDPATDGRTVAVDVVALLHQDDVGLHLADDGENLLGTFLDLVAASPDVPDQDSKGGVVLGLLGERGTDHAEREEQRQEGEQASDDGLSETRCVVIFHEPSVPP